jgi:DnaJ-related protein SCJ1
MKEIIFLGIIFFLNIILCEKDLYKILEVKRSATLPEIKKKYREMTKKYHPDRNQGDEKAKEKFSEVAEAYEILSDTNKRRIYDRGGMEAVKREGQMQNQGGFDPFDMFGFGGRQQHQERRDQDVRIKIRCSLKDLYLGKEFEVIILFYYFYFYFYFYFFFTSFYIF